MGWIAACAVLTLGCSTPDSTIFTPPISEPAQIGPGLFQVTFNQGPDIVLGFSPDGSRLLYRSRGLAGLGPEWRILSIPPEGGTVREEAALYRQALLDSVANLVFNPPFRVFVVWRPSIPPIVGCGGGCPAPRVGGIAMLRLEERDGAPLSALPRVDVSLPVSTPPSTVPGGIQTQVTIGPADRELVRFGVDPFGPVMLKESSIGFYSDGVTLWRFNAADPSLPPDSVGAGAFPSISADGTTLAASIPIGVDSVQTTCVVPGMFGSCTQTTTTISNTGWLVVLYNLETGSADTLTMGVEPTFGPGSDRILVRRADSFYWVDLTSGAEEAVPRTEGGFAPAISPDGTLIAFSSSRSGNPDVYLLQVN